MRRRSFLSLAAAAAAMPLRGELAAQWKARWIWPAGAPAHDFGVYLFRRTFRLDEAPSRFAVDVTADNRYILYVNGEQVCWGPARGDLFHWRYETVDIARRLRAGDNAMAAVVWNEGDLKPIAQISNRTGFLLRSEEHEFVNTDAKWRCKESEAYRALPLTQDQNTGYWAVGPTEEMDAAKHPWGWNRAEFDDSTWKPAAMGRNGSPRDTVDGPNHWMLVPRRIPPTEETPQRLKRVRRAEGIAPPSGFPEEFQPLTVPANTEAVLLLDNDTLTTAFPVLRVRGGAGSRIALKYAEALWLPGKPYQRDKGDRDEIEGKEMLGPSDVFLPDGPERTWRPLFWRTFRYVELRVKTAADPVTILDLSNVYTGYPFRWNAKFEGGGEELDRMLEVGWRTARLCAHESYMDCPYYEQLQYAGDTRIQCLVSVYMSGDTRLMRNAIEQLDSSRTAEGATYSRAPSNLQQYIPPFSLWWIGMVHDYWMYADDPEFAREMLPGVRAVLHFYERFQKPDGLLRPMPWWNYIDWVQRWPRGTPESEPDGMSAPVHMQLLLALDYAAELEDGLGDRLFGERLRARRRTLAESVRRHYWDAGRGLFADTGQKNAYSQHANCLGVLAGLLTGDAAQAVMEKVVADASLAPVSIYFRYYLNMAMRTAGLGDRYLDMLGPWQAMLAQGLTTWAERDGFRVRSDCHAWGSSPNIEVFRTVLGIDTAAPGFRRVRIAPHPGRLDAVSGAIPHPQGELRVRLKRDGQRLEAEVVLPETVSGTLEWRGVRRELKAGESRLVIG
jgi:alpha-L-rhamnosidase